MRARSHREVPGRASAREPRQVKNQTFETLVLHRTRLVSASPTAARTLENPGRKPNWGEKSTETSRFLRAYHEHGDITARERLIEMYLPLVETFAHRYQRSDDYDDLFQAGSIGLINAIDRFDLARGGELTAFAVPNIVGEIKRHLRDTTGSVRVPRPLQELRSRVMRCEAELGAALGRRPTPSELARKLQVQEDDIARALSTGRSDQDPGEAALDVLDDSDEWLMLASAFEVLDKRERQIVYLRFVQDLSRKQVAQELGISERHLSRQTQAALAKLREQLETAGGAAVPSGPESFRLRPDTAEGSERSTSLRRRSEHQAETSPGLRREGSPKRSEQRRAGATNTARATVPQRLLDLPYHISVQVDADGHRWTARVDELPGCEGQGDSPEKAVRSVRAAMEQLIADALADGRAVPEPRSDSGHSGRLLLRMPQSLHRELARAAESQQVSLNHFIASSLTRAVGLPSGEAPRQTSRRRSGDEGSIRRANGAETARSDRANSGLVRLAIVTSLVVGLVAGVAAVILLILAWQQGW
jgi:RNA polymerase sigma-B factor